MEKRFNLFSVDPRGRTRAKFWVHTEPTVWNVTQKEWLAGRDSEFPAPWNCSGRGWITFGASSHTPEISSPGGMGGLARWQARRASVLCSFYFSWRSSMFIRLTFGFLGKRYFEETAQRLKKGNHKMKYLLGPLKHLLTYGIWATVCAGSFRWAAIDEKYPKWLTEMKQQHFTLHSHFSPSLIQLNSLFFHPRV